MEFILGLLVFAGSAFVIYLWIGAFSDLAGLSVRLRSGFESFQSNPLYPMTAKARTALGVISVFVGMVCFVAIWVMVRRPLLALPAGLAAMVTPWLIWKTTVSRRRRLFERQLAEALSLLASSLKSGVSFPQALEALSREARAPLAPELEWVVNESRLGRPMSVVLDGWSARIPSRSLAFVVSAISIAQATGGSLAGVLQNVAVMIRKTEQLKERAQSLSAEGKLSGYVVGALPFVLMAGIGMLAPDTIAPLFNTDIGNILFLVVCLLVGVGLYFINQMVDIEV